LKSVGFWTKSVFTNLKDHAGFITWGGYTRSPKGNTSPLIGNGKWHGKNSVFASNEKCYQASTFFDSMFYYGGPGGCTS
ncbi:hypothetical protein BAE44_0012153, partial [Dichanthelium oligosanthes]